MGEERSRAELVNGSRANALAENSADDQNQETNQRYANRCSATTGRSATVGSNRGNNSSSQSSLRKAGMPEPR